MATFNFNGIDDIQKRITELGSKTDDIVDRMLIAGGYVAKEELKYHAENFGHVLTGSMRDKIGYSSPKSADNERFTSVYPRGTDRKKTSNALKGYVLDYGSKLRKIEGDAWFNHGVIAAEPQVESEMRRVFEENIDKIMED